MRLAHIKDRPNDCVAVKTIIKDKVNNSPLVLRREIKILFALDHPNIIRLIEVFEDQKYVHIVTEYCSGGELLDHIVAMGGYSEREAVRLLQKILLAVSNLHHNNICHRDLKPDNFLFEDVSANAELKLIDFGLSKFFDKFDIAELESVVGTPDYVAPEVIRGVYGAKCDIWSVGVIMYVMLSGQLPFWAPNIQQVLHKITSGVYSLTAEVWRNVSPQALDLLRKLLVVDPKKRPSADEALTHPWFTQVPSDVALPLSREVLEHLKNFRVRTKFQCEAYTMIVKYLNVRQIQDLKAAFLALDRARNGYLTADEVKQGLINAGYDVAAHEIEAIMTNVNFKKDGRINYSEFLVATLESKALLDEDAMWSAFNSFDVEKTGRITERGVKEALKRAGRKMSQKDVKAMMTEINAPKQGLSYTDFKQLVRHQTI